MSTTRQAKRFAKRQERKDAAKAAKQDRVAKQKANMATMARARFERERARHAPDLLRQGAGTERAVTVRYIRHLLEKCDTDELTLDDVIKGLETEEHWALHKQQLEETQEQAA